MYPFYASSVFLFLFSLLKTSLVFWVVTLKICSFHVLEVGIPYLYHG